MKKAVLLLLCLVAFSASAQEFKPFKVNLSLGYAKPLGAGASAGFLLALEPKYSLNDNLELGLRLESAIVARAFSYQNQTGDAEVKGLGSYLLTGNYFFSTENFRPYVGVGAGLYTVAGTTVTIVNGQANDNYVVQGETKFGLMGRAGFKAGHFNLSVEYNAVPKSSSKLQSVTLESKNAYVGIKLGVDIGGGRY
jgi:outer membrane protein W